ncbi:MAG: tRNA 2-thiouridine(34) synthase MnmA, partial [Clostridia bacterium]|nr:tRNA 2-thiouridine(34) synthase MnmA [Clostridia bacterium]
MAAVRYRGVLKPALVSVTGKNSVHVRFLSPQRAITRGQAVVLYDGDVVLGGGTIL